jgi:hypothetical protein
MMPSGIGQVHRPTIARHQPGLAPEELPQHCCHRRPSKDGVGVAPVRGEDVVVRPPRRRDSYGDRFLADSKVAGPFDKVR